MKEERKREFGSDCVIWSMRRYYPGYAGREKWLVVSDLCGEELEQRHPELATVYAPYVQITRAQAYVILKSEAEEKRSRKRAAKHTAWEDEGPGAGPRRLRREAWQRAYLRQEAEERTQEVREALKRLPPVMRRRVERYYFEGYRPQEIADMEKVHPVTVYRAISRSQETLREILEEMRTDPQQRLTLQRRIRGEIDRVIPIRTMRGTTRGAKEQAVRLNLCTVCRRLILEEGTCRLRRLDPYERPKERCDVCAARAGCMHLVTRRAGSGKGNAAKDTTRTSL